MARCTALPVARPWAAVLEEVLSALPSGDVARLAASDREHRAAVDGAGPRLLPARGVDCGEGEGWQKAHAVERALFHDAPADPCDWIPGPNDKSPGNALEIGEEQRWLWLSQGTDWQGFQGGFRKVSEEGLRPRWITFKVRIATPAFSAANLALSSMDRARWAFIPSLMFGYRGDDMPQHRRRCFQLEVFCPEKFAAQKKRPSPSTYTWKIPEEMEVDHAYEIALRFDWDAGTLSAFVDGQTLAAGAPFSRTMPLRYIAVYNWRSLARAAFSELMFSGACPYRLPAPPAPARRKRARCARPPTAVLAAVAVCLVAVALPLLLPSWQ